MGKLALFIALISFVVHAQSTLPPPPPTSPVPPPTRSGVPPFLTRCEINYQFDTLSLFAEIGGGTGQAVCWDSSNHSYYLPINIAEFGLGLQVGHCAGTGQISAVGVGFTFTQLFTAIGSIRLGSIAQNEGFGVMLSPTLNIDIFTSNTEISSPSCLQVIAGEVMAMAPASAYAYPVQYPRPPAITRARRHRVRVRRPDVHQAGQALR